MYSFPVVRGVRNSTRFTPRSLVNLNISSQREISGLIGFRKGGHLLDWNYIGPLLSTGRLRKLGPL